jgi:hypothetical protein
MAYTLDQLPRFTVTNVVANEGYTTYLGTFDSMPRSDSSWRGYLCVRETHFVCGHFFQMADDAIRFVPWDKNQPSCLDLGFSYPYLDGSWGEKAALVLDPTRQWQRREFQPEDAFEVEPSEPGGARRWGKASQHEQPQGRIIPGGWQHEHCAICWETIARYAKTHGYKSSDDTWICESCYERYVVTRSIDFMKRPTT